MMADKKIGLLSRITTGISQERNLSISGLRNPLNMVLVTEKNLIWTGLNCRNCGANENKNNRCIYCDSVII